MRSLRMRRTCPACLGVALESTSIAKVVVHHCGRCGGTWLTRAHAALLRNVPTATLHALIRRADHASFVCHGCHVPLSRGAERCAACGQANTLECPECGRCMRRETRQGVTVDVCRPCTSMWLDHHELSSLWMAATAVAVSPHAGTYPHSGDILADGLLHAPEFTFRATYEVARFAGDATGAGVEAASHVASAGMRAAANAPEIASGLAEAAGDAAGGVFSFIAEILGGLFGGI